MSRDTPEQLRDAAIIYSAASQLPAAKDYRF
jgi:hypothetical protein